MSRTDTKVSRKTGQKTNGTPRARVKGNGTNVPSRSGSGHLVPLSQDSRWAGWLAGATEAQAERFRRLQEQAGVEVKDDELPPALRGNALDAF